MKATSEPVDSITNKLCHTIKELGLKFWSGYKSAFETMIVNCKTADMPVYHFTQVLYTMQHRTVPKIFAIITVIPIKDDTVAEN